MIWAAARKPAPRGNLACLAAGSFGAFGLFSDFAVSLFSKAWSSCLVTVPLGYGTRLIFDGTGPNSMARDLLHGTRLNFMARWLLHLHTPFLAIVGDTRQFL